MNAFGYYKWRAYKQSLGLALEEHEPVGFFELGDKTAVTVDLDYKRACRYIYLKPTGLRQNVAKEFGNYPMEIKYFGVSGVVQD
jgi:hypothetical protein